ncbi:MAG: hypothetical protein HQK77_06675 [Desulfobacterales bacterium]|nr:hypothetical protein [Desulfobacterales bacterium]
MDIEELKAKFKHKIRADIKDIDLVLKAAPVLIKEINRLEEELNLAQERITHLSSQCKKRPPLTKSGKKGKTQWTTEVDEKKNCLYFQLAGNIDYRGAKSATNSILTVIPNLRPDFDFICDISQLNPEYDKKFLFHIRKVMYHLKLIGIRQIVKIINPLTPELGIIFDDNQKKSSYTVHSAKSIEDAEKVLENIATFLKI